MAISLNRLHRFLGLVTLTVALTSGCSQEKAKEQSSVKEGGQAEDSISSSNASAIKMPAVITTTSIGIKALLQEPVDYTFGAASLTFPADLGPVTAVDRFLHLSDASVASAPLLQILTPLCRDITFVGEGSNSLTWRSHYSLIVKRQLADLLENGQTQILCVLRITDARSSRYIAFDPMPDLGFTGTTQGSKAVELAVTLPLAKTISLKSANLLLIQGVAQNLSGIKALKSDAITSQARPETGVPCFYDTSKGASTVGNPTTLKTTMLDLKSSTVPDLKVQSVLPVPVSGRNLASCAGVSLKSVTATVQSEFTCQTYQDTKTEGLEAGCQWQLEIANGSDPQNTVAVPLQLAKQTFKAIDLTKSDEALSLLPQSPLNPVRSKSAAFTGGFSQPQLDQAARAFDLWIDVYPKSFNEDFNGFMKEVRLDNTCASGIAGRAEVGSTSFMWCSPNLATTVNNPSRPVFHAILVAHETRHSRGYNHDFLRPDYTPCQGSAASAAVMHAIVATCQEDYCAVLRNAALSEYITEINYSLQGDARRFQGQCAAWSSSIGLTNASFNTNVSVKK